MLTLPLVEREVPLAALQQRLDAAARVGHVVLVAGEAGIGKTSVLRALALRHAAAGGTVWWGACDALDTPHPLAPLLDMAREGQHRLAAALAGPRPALFEAVLQELRGAVQPMLMVVEDAHWADDATLDLLKFLGRRMERTRALLAVSYRDDEVGPAHPLRRVLGEMPPAQRSHLPLARLSPPAVEQLARQAGRPAEGVHAATGGNAFFVTELLRDDSHPRGAVPRSVQDVVLARYAGLPESAQALLRLVSVLPGRTERWLADALLAPSLQDWQACLDSGLLVAEGPVLGYRHELARVAVEHALSPPQAQDLHARVLAALAAPVRQIAAARLVHHALQAGDVSAISLHAPQAAAQASERGSHREAHAQWQLALRMGRPADADEQARWLLAALAAAGIAGASAAALQAGQALEALALARGDQARAALHRSQQANAFIGLLAHREASAASQAALAMVEPLLPSPEKANVWANEALIRMLERDCEAGAARARLAIAMGEALGDENSVNVGRIALGASLLFVDFAQGVQTLEEVLASRRAVGAPRPVAAALQMLGSGLGELMRLALAEAYLREALALATARELDSIRDYSGAWLALCLMWRGRWDEAAAVAAAPLQHAASTDMSRLMALLALARLRVRRGDPGAGEALDEALALAAPSGTLQRVGPTHAARAEAAFMRGDPPAVRAEVDAVLPLARERRHPWFIGELAYWSWCADGRRPAAAAADAAAAAPFALQMAGRWRDAAAAWHALDCPYEAARALAEGDDDAQRAALAVFDALGARPAAESLRRRLREAGVRGVARGARASTRSHPLGLTRAEVQVLQLLAQDLRNADIAARLHRSVRTVDHHVASVLAKLGAATRLEAVRRAEREQWWGEPAAG